MLVGIGSWREILSASLMRSKRKPLYTICQGSKVSQQKATISADKIVEHTAE